MQLSYNVRLVDLLAAVLALPVVEDIARKIARPLGRSDRFPSFASLAAASGCNHHYRPVPVFLDAVARGSIVVHHDNTAVPADTSFPQGSHSLVVVALACIQPAPSVDPKIPT